MTAVEEENKDTYEFFVQVMVDGVDALDNEDVDNLESTIAEIERYPRQFFDQVFASTVNPHKR